MHPGRVHRPASGIVDLRREFPSLDALCREAGEIGGLEVRVFGSALRSSCPRDLDVLVLYSERDQLLELRSRLCWETADPPIDLIAMTVDEDEELAFSAGVMPIALVPARGPVGGVARTASSGPPA